MVCLTITQKAYSTLNYSSLQGTIEVTSAESFIDSAVLLPGSCIVPKLVIEKINGHDIVTNEQLVNVIIVKKHQLLDCILEVRIVCSISFLKSFSLMNPVEVYLFNHFNALDSCCSVCGPCASRPVSICLELRVIYNLGAHPKLTEKEYAL